MEQSEEVESGGDSRRDLSGSRQDPEHRYSPRLQKPCVYRPPAPSSPFVPLVLSGEPVNWKGGNGNKNSSPFSPLDVQTNNKISYHNTE